MRSSVTLVFLLMCFSSEAQNAYTDSLRRVNKRMLLSDLFWSGQDDGFYAGITGSGELKSLGLGVGAKFYSAYYSPLLSSSLYSNARHLYTSNESLSHTAISCGAHFSILALEGTVYMGGEHTRWYVTPKIGMDWGNFSIFAGYGFPIGTNGLSRSYSPTISVNYFIHLNAISYYFSRKNSWLRSETKPAYSPFSNHQSHSFPGK